MDTPKSSQAAGSYKEYKVTDETQTKNRPKLQRMDSFSERKGKEKAKNEINVLQQGYHSIKEKFTKSERQQTKDDTQFIVETLQHHFVFYKIKQAERTVLAQKFFYCLQKKGEFVINQGDDAQYFFIINSGSVDVQIDGATKRELKKGDGFGELALMYNAVRSASIITKEDSSFWVLDRVTFKKILQDLVSEEFEINRKFIEKISFFNNLTPLQTDGVAGLLIEQKFKQDQWIVNVNDQAESFYVIKKGQVGVYNQQGEQVTTLGEGKSFGENALMSSKAIRSMTIKALEETVCLALARDTLHNLLGNQVESIINRNIARWSLDKTQWAKHLESNQFDQLLDIVEAKPKHQGEVVLPKLTTLSHQLLLVLDGAVGYKKDHKVVAEKFGSIGAQDIYDLSSNKCPDDLIVVSEKCTVGILRVGDITKAIGGALKDVVENNKKKQNQKQEMEISLEKTLRQINFNDFICLKHLGAGQFGNVYLVKLPNQDNIYALKCISKKQVCSSHLEKYVIAEKEVMEVCNFPFIMRYFRSFQDDFYVFFLLEYISGAELFDVIRDIGLLSTFDAQYYIACTLLAIEYLHKHHIVYRDIKPENIMVDQRGIAKLVDMGTAHKFSRGHKTTTIIGTPHYMAPEVLAGKGHSYYVDLWSLGVMLYEFLAGAVPFAEDAEDPYEIYETIMNNKITYPSFFTDQNAKSFVEQLLSKTPEMRLSGGSYSKLRKHEFFTKFDWNQLVDGTLKAPWYPPAEKRLTPQIVQGMEGKGKKLAVELKDQYQGQPPKSKKNPTWDKDIFDF